MLRRATEPPLGYGRQRCNLSERCKCGTGCRVRPTGRESIAMLSDQVGISVTEEMVKPANCRALCAWHRPLKTALTTVLTRCAGRGRWWSLTESNRRHPACKAGALPTELRPPTVPEAAASKDVVGRGGLEPPTSRLSGVRSNHLSYRPKNQTGRSVTIC